MRPIKITSIWYCLWSSEGIYCLSHSAKEVETNSTQYYDCTHGYYSFLVYWYFCRQIKMKSLKQQNLLVHKVWPTAIVLHCDYLFPPLCKTTRHDWLLIIWQYLLTDWKVKCQTIVYAVRNCPCCIYWTAFYYHGSESLFCFSVHVWNVSKVFCHDEKLHTLRVLISDNVRTEALPNSWNFQIVKHYFWKTLNCNTFVTLEHYWLLYCYFKTGVLSSEVGYSVQYKRFWGKQCQNKKRLLKNAAP